MAAKFLFFRISNSFLAIGVFGAAESEFEVKIAKLRMADRTWWPKFSFFANQTEFAYRGFLGH